jgi:hypothetical protein
MPAVASADSVDGADMAAYLPDFDAVAAAAAVITPPTVPDGFADFAISVSGIPLYQSGSAFAESSFGNIAIAHGASTEALAYGGFFNSANVDGDDSIALVGNQSTGFFNTASVTGDHSVAEAAYGFGSGSGNTATVTGDMSTAYAGTPNGGLPPAASTQPPRRATRVTPPPGWMAAAATRPPPLATASPMSARARWPGQPNRWAPRPAPTC